MRMRALGQARTQVFPLGLGCMGMSEFYGATDDSESLKTLSRAWELGINFFDTADTYGFGHNETLVGQFLSSTGLGKRENVVIATKFGIVRAPGQFAARIRNDPEYIRSACHASLKRLGVDVIDLYYCHRRDKSVPIEDVVGALSDLVREGKVRQIGFSEISANSLRRAHSVHPVAAVQCEYSLWSRARETEMLRTCAELGVTFVAYSPLGRAFLTGTVKNADLADNDLRKKNPRFCGEAEEKNRTLVDALNRFARTRDLTNAQAALAWLLSKHNHVVPIPGTRRIKNLEENIGATNYQLTAEDVFELDALFVPEAVTGARYPERGMLGIEP